jgi:hypothetical protein
MMIILWDGVLMFLFQGCEKCFSGEENISIENLHGIGFRFSEK